MKRKDALAGINKMSFQDEHTRVDAQQTRHVAPVLGQCWASVVDGGAALAQHQGNMMCLRDA